MWFPRARDLNAFSDVDLGDEHVIYVDETMAYHTITDDCFRLWHLCDGSRSVSDLALAVYLDSGPTGVARAELALHQLTEANLLDSPQLRLDRRRMLQLSAAVVAGGFALPRVTSITAPGASAALTDVVVVPTLAPDVQCFDGDSGLCATTCCCQLPSGYAKCYDSAACHAAGYPCI
jgi:hypothetical protein